MSIRNIFNKFSTPVNAPEKLRRDDPKSKKIVFDAEWDVRQAPPNTKVGLTAVSKVQIEGGTTAQIRIFQLLNKERTYVGSPIYAPYENGQVKAAWLTTTVNGGDFAGEYHFEVSVGNYFGETSEGLRIGDVTKRYVDDFQKAKPKPKVVF